METAPEFSIFVGDLAPEVTDQMLQDIFLEKFPSTLGAKVRRRRRGKRRDGVENEARQKWRARGCAYASTTKFICILPPTPPLRLPSLPPSHPSSLRRW
jgi:hypothetical protein